MRASLLRPGDVSAGVVVGLALLPQAIAYAGVAGLAPDTGITAAAVGAVVAAALASYRLLQTGPTALTAALAAGALGAAGSGHDRAALAALLALLVGVARVALGLLGLGGIAYLASEPVLAGFLPGIAIVIALGQVPALVGVTPEQGARTVAAAVDALADPAAWQTQTVLLGLACLVALAALRRVDPRLPAGAIVLGAAIAVGERLAPEAARIGPVGLATPIRPDALPWSAAPSLALGAIVIALVGFVEPTTIVRAREEDASVWDPDRELVAQGAANLCCGVAGGMPVGGSFNRSALLREAGGRGRAAPIIAGLVVLAAVPAGPVLARLPVAAVAALVVASVLPLARPAALGRLRRTSRPQLAIAVATLIATLALAPRLDLAIATGIGLSLLHHLRQETRVGVRVERADGRLVLRPLGVLWFASAHRFERAALAAIDAAPADEAVVVDLAGVGRLDVTGVRAVARVLAAAQARGASAEVTGVPAVAEGMVRRVLAEDDHGGLVLP